MKSIENLLEENARLRSLLCDWERMYEQQSVQLKLSKENAYEWEQKFTELEISIDPLKHIRFFPDMATERAAITTPTKSEIIEEHLRSTGQSPSIQVPLVPCSVDDITGLPIINP